MQEEKEPIVGVSTAFTGKYQSSRIIIRFLELMNVNLVKSNITKPSMIEAGTTLASADFCLPLRVYVGHIYVLFNEHPEINYLLTPIVKGEHPDSNTCAKYRDIDGVIIRSLNSMTEYNLKQIRNDKNLKRIEGLLSENLEKRFANTNKGFPIIIAPEIESLEKSHLKQVCIKTYADIYNFSSAKKFRYLTNSLLKYIDKNYAELEKAYNQAYYEIIEKKLNRYERLISKPEKIRLALLGRSYLVNDSALSADIKSYFVKKGVSVITTDDIPFEELEESYKQVNGFYDYHKIGQAFIDRILDDVDGFIVIGSFGCHPDAFQIEHFAKYITSKGKSCWTFKFDEQTGGAGFQTRFETILGFLEKKRDKRLELKKEQAKAIGNETFNNNETFKESNVNKAPIFIWPYMGDGINLILKEIWFKLGLDKYMYPPKPVHEDTIMMGDIEYTETCSPFALYLGSLRDTLNRLIKDFEEEFNDKRYIEPKRIIVLMAGGKGPCTFGWYSIAGKELLLKEYKATLAKYGHSLEMVSIDNQGRNLLNFVHDIATVTENKKLFNIIDKISIIKDNKQSTINKTKAEISLIKLLKGIVWTGWEKLLAFEEIQNEALVVRAHELNRGDTTTVLKKWIVELDSGHTLPQIAEIKSEAKKALSEIKQDNLVKPKVVVVGEIYVSLTSFANRGTVDNLLGKLGIEAVEGMRLSHFIKGAFKGLKYSYLHNQGFISPVVNFLSKRGLYNPNNWVREPNAKPFLKHEVGGDGQPTVARARHHIEEDCVDGILHIYPFKCMPEGIAKDALVEISQLYGLKTLHLSFSKETEIERLKTELGTFASLLHQDIELKKKDDKKEIKRRKELGKVLDMLYKEANSKKKINFQINYNNKMSKLLKEQFKRE